MRKLSVLIAIILIIASKSSAQFYSISRINPVPVSMSASTADKPQSKVWTYDGKQWAVLPNNLGTFIYRLDDTVWTSVLKISSATNAKADCKVVGNVTHILLFRGSSSNLVSVEYVPASATYKLWTKRTSTVNLSLASGVETAVIDIDGTGRMWMAYDADTTIFVKWSDSPYSSWSSPILLANDLSTDDICSVIAMNAIGKVGVLWSSQKLKKFGFRTHTDGTDPNTWTADEAPSAAYAPAYGAGFGDDHLNMTVAKNGTVYCAVKTSYDNASYPNIILLIRRPAGTWDKYYEVAKFGGTRPIGILNEALGKLKIIYADDWNGGNIVYKETKLSKISFGSEQTLISGKFDDPTSMKQNYSNNIVIMASNSSQAVSVLASDGPLPSPPVAPALISPANQASAVPTSPTIKWGAPATATSYHLQVSTDATFASPVFDQVDIDTTFFPVTGLATTTVYYWRVQAANAGGISPWSLVRSFTTDSRVLAGTLVGYWKMEEGGDTLLLDDSPYGNTAKIYGNPSWVPGAYGLGLKLNGSSQYAVAPDTTYLDLSNAITVAAWIKPKSKKTQDIISKALNGTTDGYQLSLSSGGLVYFRINEKSSGDTYRLNSVSTYPYDGNTWTHIAATFDGTTMKIYIDGIENASKTLTSPRAIAQNSVPLGIGAQSNGSSKYTGDIDDVRIYNTVLSPAQIDGLVTGGPLIPLPLSPPLIAPANAAANISVPVTLSWGQGTYATTYQVQVSTLASFTTTVFNHSGIAGTSIPVTGLSANTVYYWRVLSANKTGVSAWSSTNSFTTNGTVPTGIMVGNWKMDGTLVATLIDDSPFVNNATTAGAPTKITGAFGQALHLNGSSQYAIVPDNPSLNITNSITLAGWIRPQSAANQNIIIKGLSIGTDGYELSLASNGKVFCKFNNATSGDTYRLNSTTSYPTNGTTWMHVAATYDGSTLKIYINGAENASKVIGPVVIGSNGSPLGIGAQPDGTSSFDGDLDDIRLYNVVLNPLEIRNLVVGGPVLIPPLAPTLLSPANLAAAVNVPVTLSWNAENLASNYEVQVSAASDFSNIIFDQDNLTATSAWVTGLSSNTDYFWRVKASNATGASDWSATWKFTTNLTVPTGTLVGNWKMDEAAGPSLADASPFANNAATVANPTKVAGAFGTALNLNGTTQYATFPDNPSLDMTNAITLAAWIKPKATANQNILNKTLAAIDGYELSIASTGKVFFRFNQASSGDNFRVNSATSYPTNGTTWMHVAATFDGTVMKIYINGTENASKVLTSPANINPNALAMAIGALPDGTAKFSGAIDEARLYNVALTAAEVRQLALNGPVLVAPDSPVLISPTDVAINNPVNTTLTWNAMPRATAYQVQVAPVADFSTTVFDQNNLSAASVPVLGLLINTTYYWRVKAGNAAGTSDWSAVWSFTTDANGPSGTLVGNWKMDEANGNSFLDNSPYLNSGTGVGTPTRVAGAFGTAVKLNGTSQYLTIPDLPSLDITNTITLAAWIRPRAAASQNIIKKALSTTTDGYELSLASNGQVFFRFNNATSGDTYRVNSVATYPTNGTTWMHIAATYDGSVMKIYINGTENASKTVSSPPLINANSLALGIGAQHDGTGKLNGDIDEARLYNEALSAANIRLLALNGPVVVAPDATTQLTPTDAFVATTISPVLTWNAAPRATQYQIQVAPAPDFSNTVYDQSGISATNTTVTGLLVNTTYYWRVKASNSAGASDWSAPWSFTTDGNGPTGTLVGYWKMDEASGTTLLDASPFGNNSTTVGNPSRVAGAFGQALSLNGTSQYATATDKPSLDISNAISIAAWIRPKSKINEIILKKALNTTTDGYELSLTSGGLVYFRFNNATSGDTYRLNSVATYPTNGTSWMHVAATFDGTTIKIYINGTENASKTIAGPVLIKANALALGIGAQHDGTSKFLGDLDEVRLYNAALTPAEVRSLAINGPVLIAPDAPTLTAPIAAATAVSIPANLTWDPTLRATSYQLQVSQQADFANTIYDQTNLTANAATVTGFSLSTVYYWRVKAFNAAGESDWSNVWNFTTDSNGPSGPLVGHWKMEEPSGTILTDASPYGNNATTIGNPGKVAGAFGQALSLNGTSQYATALDNAYLDINGNITVAAWIRPKSKITETILKKALNTSTDGYELSLSSTGQVFFRFNAATSGDNYRVNSVASYPTNGTTWMHVAATYNGSEIKIYINGTENASKTIGSIPINTNNLDLAIGAQNDGTSKFLGDLDEVRLYKTALNAQEIRDLAINGPVLVAPEIASLATPTNLATGISIPANLTWNAGLRAASYQVQVSKAADFATTLYDQSGLTATSTSVTGLLTNTIYYWRVKSENAAGESDWSAAWSFITGSVGPSGTLVGHWKMDEASGTALLDTSPYGNSATTIGNPVRVAGAFGQALNLNGTSQYATALDNPYLDITGALTIAAWIRPKAALTQSILKKATSSTDGFELSLSSSGKVFFRFNQASSADIYRANSVTSYPTNGTTWMHVAATYNGSEIKIYINGVENSSVTLNAPPAIVANALDLAIGAQPDGAGKFNGDLDDVRLYNDVLTAADIRDLVIGGPVLLPPDAPALALPTDKATEILLPPTLTWNAAPNAVSYQIQVSDNVNFTTTAFDKTGITTTSSIIAGLAKNTSYFWRVRATNAAGSSLWSTIWSFKTDSNVPTGTLIGFWKMDDPTSAILADVSPYANTATSVGNPAMVTGKNGQALSLDGTSQYATVSHNPYLNITGAITLSAWIKPSALVTQYVVKKAVSGATNGYELSLSSTGKVFFRLNQKSSGDTYRLNSITSYPTNGTTWMHIAATFDGTVMKIYINGIENASKTLTSPVTILTNTNPLAIGAQSDGSSKFKGTIDEVRLYNVALPPAEVSNLLLSGPPAAPGLIAPADLATGVAVPVNLTWNGSSGASSYAVEVSALQDFSTTIYSQSNISATTANVPGLAINTAYFWRVRGTNSEGTGSWSVARKFTTFDVPGIVTLTSPTNNQANVDLNANLTWNTAPSATSYEVQVSTTSDFSTTAVFSQNLILTNTVQVSGLQANSSYFWRARAINSVGTGPWSATLAFTTLNRPAIPTLSLPANNATSVALSPVLNWNTVANASAYQLQVSTASDFSTAVINQNNIAGTSASLNNLLPNTVYYWKVQATNSAGNGNWSSVWSFTTLASQVNSTALVGHWQMEETSGATLIDASTHGNNATTVGSPTRQTGVIGQALQLNGTSQYATVSNNSSLNITSAITLASWIRPGAVATQYLIKKSVNGSTDGYELSLASSGKVFFRINQKTSGDTYRLNSATSYPTNGATWMHIAATYDGTVMKLYINGIEEASKTLASPVTIATNTTALGIGAQADGSSKFKGTLDEVRLYNIALTAADVNSLLNTTPPAVPAPAAPTLTAPLDFASGITLPANLSWNAVANATAYKVQVSPTGDFASPIYDQESIATTSTSVPGLADNTVYYWRVLAANSSGNSGWSPIWSFTTAASSGLSQTSTLVGFWQIEESNGTTLVDGSAYGNNGTTVGLPTRVTGAKGQGLHLNGTNQYATIPDNSTLNISNTISLAAWIKPNSQATQYIIKKAINNNTDGYELSLANSGKIFIRFNQASSGDTYRLNSATSYPTNGTTWMHVAATFDGTVMKIYINGIENASKTLSGPLIINTNTLPLTIGAQQDGTSEFNGDLDEVQIYNAALTPAEINNLASIPSARVASSQPHYKPFSVLKEESSGFGYEELKANPNPMSAKATLSYLIPSGGDYTLSLYNNEGRIIKTLKKGTAEAGEPQTLEFNASNFPAGLYIVKLQTSKGIKSLRVVIQR